MSNKNSKLAIRVSVGGLCGLLMATSLGNVACSNPQTPEYMCEKHKHLSEQKRGVDNHFEDITYVSSVAASGVSATTTTTLPIEYCKGINSKGGEG